MTATFHMDPMEINIKSEDRLASVKHIILIMSGKGGVGKSTVAVQLAVGLRNAGFKVGLLDADLCGPSIPTMLNIEHKKSKFIEGWEPVFVDVEQRLSVMSVGFLLASRNDAIILRGPKKNVTIKQFLNDVYWRDIDYLIIDTPPGTSDEHISITENLRKYNLDGAVLVTTPQAVATGDVRRELSFCKKTNIPIIGIVENMSGFICPHCQECTNIFSKGGGQSLAKLFQVSFLGSIPICPQISRYHDGNAESLKLFSQTTAQDSIDAIVKKLIK